MLSQQEKLMFVRDGFLVVKGLLDAASIQPLLAEYEAILEQGLKKGVKMPSGGTAVSNSAELVHLYQQPRLQQLRGDFLAATEAVTNQLVVWTPQQTPEYPYGLVHVDRPIGNFGRGPSLPFDLAIGVMLQGEMRTHTGNLGVYPGSHRAFERYFQKFPERTFWNGIPEVPMPLVHEVLLEPGDVVAFQSQLGHTSMPHQGGLPKLAAYFKIAHPDRLARGEGALRSIWDGYRAEFQRIAAELDS